MFASGQHMLLGSYLCLLEYFLFSEQGVIHQYSKYSFFTYFVIFLSIFCFMFTRDCNFFDCLNLTLGSCRPNFEIFHQFKPHLFRQNYHYFRGKQAIMLRNKVPLSCVFTKICFIFQGCPLLIGLHRF